MDKIPWTLIIAKLSNTLTEADNRLLEEWLQNDLHKEMDYVILVWVDQNTQIQRVRKSIYLCHMSGILFSLKFGIMNLMKTIIGLLYLIGLIK